MTSWLTSIRDGVTIYGDRRIILIFIMGIASGLPLLLTLSTLSFWLRKEGVDLTTIGIFAAVGTPYSIKFLWAPAIDRLPFPFLTKQLGQRRGWAIAIQIALTIAIASLGFTDPASNPYLTGLVAMAIAFFSASQDIVIDALRIELLKDDEQGAGAAATQGGYRVGMLVAGAGALLLSDYFDWSLVFIMVAAFMPFGMLAVLLAKEPDAPSRTASRDIKSFLLDGVVAPFLDFLKRPAPWAILIFVLLYKFGDAIGGTMTNPFYADMGFSGTEIGLVSKTAGFVATMLGVVVGGSMVRAIGLVPALITGGILQAATNVLFAWLAISGPDTTILATAVWSDNFTGGLGSAAFVAYLSALCNRDFTATQYALLTAFMAFGRTLLSTPSGWLAEQMGWAEFFIATAFLAVPGLLLIAYLSRHGYGLSSAKN